MQEQALAPCCLYAYVMWSRLGSLVSLTIIGKNGSHRILAQDRGVHLLGG